MYRKSGKEAIHCYCEHQVRWSMRMTIITICLMAVCPIAKINAEVWKCPGNRFTSDPEDTTKCVKVESGPVCNQNGNKYFGPGDGKSGDKAVACTKTSKSLSRSPIQPSADRWGDKKFKQPKPDEEQVVKETSSDSESTVEKLGKVLRPVQSLYEYINKKLQ